MDIDLEELAVLVDLLKGAEFSEFRYEKGDLRLVIRRGPLPADPAVPDPPARAAATGSDRAAAGPASAAEASGRTFERTHDADEIPAGSVQVTAPLLGTFYTRPKPGEPPFVNLGDRVEADTVIGIVEVMKLMNSVNAGCAGIVVAVHAAEGQLVEFGQPLVSIAPEPR